MLLRIRAMLFTTAGLCVLGALAYVLLTQYLSHREDVAISRLPVRAVQTRAAARWPTRLVPDCPAVVELLPPTKDRAKLERDFGVNLGSAIPGSVRRGGEALSGDQGERHAQEPTGGSGPINDPGASRVLGLFEVPRMPRGGEALATLPANGKLDLTFRANPPRFLGFRPIWGGGVLVDPTKPADRWNVYALLEPLHLRERWHLRLTAGAEGRDGAAGALLLAGIEYRTTY